MLVPGRFPLPRNGFVGGGERFDPVTDAHPGSLNTGGGRCPHPEDAAAVVILLTTANVVGDARDIAKPVLSPSTAIPARAQ